MRRCLTGTAVTVIVFLAVPVGCGGRADGPATADPEPSGVTSPSVTTAPIVPADLPAALRDRMDPALDRGGRYAGAHLEDIGPASLAFFDHMHRRWAVPGLASARDVAEAAPETDNESERMLLRLVRPDRPKPALTVPGDGLRWQHDILVTALHCDQAAPPRGWAERVARQAERGVYEVTHAAYAVQWARELRCVVPGLDDAAEALLVALVGHVVELSVVDDESLAVSAVLGYLGRPDQVPLAWLEAVLDAQRDDGGWAEREGEEASSWHTTGLALWTLAAATGPGVADEPLVVTG